MPMTCFCPLPLPLLRKSAAAFCRKCRIFSRKVLPLPAAALLLLGIAPGLQGHLRTMFASLALMSCTAWLFYSLVIINNKIDKE